MSILHVVFVGMALTWTPARGEQDSYDDMTDAQIKAVQMTAIARFAGTRGTCPRFHLIEKAELADWADAKIPEEMVGTPYFDNLQTVVWMGAIERQRENPSDFCRAAWQLFGPKGLYRRQLLEAN
jgi:hypothetical protein